MGLLSFFKDAGESLIPSFDIAASDPSAFEASAADAITAYIGKQGIDATGLTVSFDAGSSGVTVSGEVPDQVTLEKVVLCCGNVKGVGGVNDNLVAAVEGDESQWYDVVSGDNLSKIAQKLYGDPNRYQGIFEGNKPMLSSPDKIYPGQKLRIPSLA